ncbi:MAG TPA: tetratricopeptide repeat protein [Acidobacteriota bacterium]|nr:tetratricopeptide repeat protein [Acidobacteriota bacterium]
MRKNYTIQAIAILSFLLTTLPLWAAKNNALTVQCLDPDGNPLAKVQVWIMDIGSQDIKDENTNREGRAEFKKLQDGIYRVWARSEGFAPAFQEFFVLENGASKEVTLSLEPGDPNQALYFEDGNLAARANELLQQGAALLHQQKFDEAEKVLQEALSVNPSEPNTHFNLALVYLNQKQWDKAEESLHRAQALLEIFARANPNNPMLRQQLENIRQQVELMPLRKLAGEIDTAMQNKEFETAVDKLEEMAELQPNNPNVYYNAALAYIQMNRMDEAVEQLDKAIELDPNQQAFTELKGRIGEIQEARAEAALKAKVATVQSLNQEGKHAEAIEKAKESLEEVGDDLKPTLWAEMANAYMALKDYPQAVAAYTKYLELKGEPVDQGLFELGQRFVRAGNQEQAKLVFEKVLEVNPAYAEAYYQLGMHAFYEENDKEKAKQLLSKYLEIGQDENNRNNAQNVLVVIEKS